MTKKDIKKDIMAVRDEVHRLQDEAAKNPDHWINDGKKSLCRRTEKTGATQKSNLK